MGTYNIEKGYQKPRRIILRAFLTLLPLLIVGFGSYRIYKQTDTAPTSTKPVAAVAANIKLSDPIEWPNYGQAGYGVVDHGVLSVSDDSSKAVPIASLAKVITALAIQKQKPLAPGESGPLITLTEADVAKFSEYVTKSGAVVAVEAGEQISQQQAMEAMLLPSANNIADALAVWAFGSMDAYKTYANTMVKEYGLSDTTVDDASGFSPETKSTAHDMVELGIRYMKDPTLVEIARKGESKIPVQGLIKNYNATSNVDGILGIKVGNTDEAGRCFLVADIRDNNVVAVAVVLGAEHIQNAMDDSKKIFSSGNKSYDQSVLN